jgi:hypothetical protein
MPAGTIETTDIGSGGGHHYSFNTPQGPAYYATIENPITWAGSPKGSVGVETHFQTLTEVTSHELVEAITDPLIVNGAGTGWTQEIGDYTQNNPPPDGVMGMVDGYAVQKYWSNQNNTSIIPGGTDWNPWLGVPTLGPTNSTFTLDSLENGQWVLIPVAFKDYDPVDSAPGEVAYTVQWGSQQEPALAIFSLDFISDKLDVTIRASDSTLLFRGQISSPDSSWYEGVNQSHAEMSGTDYQQGNSSQQFIAFGWLTYPNPQTPTGGGGSNGFTVPFPRGPRQA